MRKEGLMRMRRNRLRDHSINRLIPNMLTPVRALRGPDQHPLRHGCALGTRGAGDSVRRHLRRARRPDCAAARFLFEVRGGARLLERLHQLRRRAVGGAVHLGDGRLEEHRLGADPAVQRRHGAAPRALQHQARQCRSSGLAQPLLHRRAGAGRGRAGAAAADRLAAISRKSTSCATRWWSARSCSPWPAWRSAASPRSRSSG